MSTVNLLGNVLTPFYDSLYIIHSPILDEAVKDYNAKIDGVVGRLLVSNNHIASVQVEDRVLNRVITMNQSSTTPAHRAPPKVHDLDTSQVAAFPPNGDANYCIFFSCPVIRRRDKVPPTQVRRDSSKPTWGGYFNRSNRAEINIPWYSYLFFTAASLLLGSLSLLPVGIISNFRRNHSTHEQRVFTLCWMIFGFVIGTLAGWFTSVMEFRTKKGIGFSKWVRFLGKMLFAMVFAAPGIGGFIVVGQMLREYGNCVTLF
jgi:hypothetical protein